MPQTLNLIKVTFVTEKTEFEFLNSLTKLVTLKAYSFIHIPSISIMLKQIFRLLFCTI